MEDRKEGFHTDQSNLSSLRAEAVLREHIAFLRELLESKKHVLEQLLESERKRNGDLEAELAGARGLLVKTQIALGCACTELRAAKEHMEVPDAERVEAWEKLLLF